MKPKLKPEIILDLAERLRRLKGQICVVHDQKQACMAAALLIFAFGIVFGGFAFMPGFGNIPSIIFLILGIGSALSALLFTGLWLFYRRRLFHMEKARDHITAIFTAHNDTALQHHAEQADAAVQRFS